MMVKLARKAIKTEILCRNWGVIAAGVGRKGQDISCALVGASWERSIWKKLQNRP